MDRELAVELQVDVQASIGGPIGAEDHEQMLAVRLGAGHGSAVQQGGTVGEPLLQGGGDDRPPAEGAEQVTGEPMNCVALGHARRLPFRFAQIRWSVVPSMARGSCPIVPARQPSNHTSTWAPASRWVTSSPMTIMQSAPASQDSRCDPGPPHGATVPATVSRCPRRNCRFPPGESIAVVSGALTTGRVMSGCPMAALIAGRRNTSNET